MINVIFAFTLTTENFILQNSDSQKLLGITIDRHLNFNELVSDQCKTTSLKITALARVFNYVTLNQSRTLMKAYFMSQFEYCPVVWMNHSRSIIKLIHFTKEHWVLSTMISLLLLPNY